MPILQGGDDGRLYDIAPLATTHNRTGDQLGQAPGETTQEFLP